MTPKRESVDVIDAHGVLLTHVGRGVADAAARRRLPSRASVTVDPRAAISWARAARDVAPVQFDDLSAHVEADSRSAWRRAAIAVMMFEPKELVEDPRTERVGMPGPVSTTLIDLPCGLFTSL